MTPEQQVKAVYSDAYASSRTSHGAWVHSIWCHWYPGYQMSKEYPTPEEAWAEVWRIIEKEKTADAK
jgi:hypothetical protein